MSRKWERMVQKNTKTINKVRTKHGKPSITETGQSVFKGRSLLYTLVLVGVSVFMLIAYSGLNEGGLYWFTVASYFLLGLFVYFVKRPFLKIGKNQISTRKFLGVKFAEAESIEKITVLPGYVIIELKGKRSRWVFSRLINRYNITEMGSKLKEFAKQNGVALQDETT